MTSDGGTTWTNATQPLGLPPVAVFHLQYVPGTGYLNAATWGRGIWRVALGRPPLISLLPSTLVVRGGFKIPTKVRIAYAVNEPTEIALSSTNLQVVSLPDKVTIEPGQTEASFDIFTAQVAASESTTIFAELGGFRQQATIRIDPPVFTITLARDHVQGGTSVLGTVTLESPAAPGTKVGLRTDNQGVALEPTSVDIPTGQTTGTFLVRTPGTNSEQWARITGALGNDERDVWLRMSPLEIESVLPSSPVFRAGQTYSVKVRLRLPSAFQSDVAVASNHPSCPTPQTVPFAPGQQEASYDVPVGDVQAPGQATFAAWKGQSFAMATVGVTPLPMTGVVRREGLVGNADPSGRVKLEFREPGASVAFATREVDLDHQGGFVADAIRLAKFDVAVKDSHWLRVVMSFDGANPAPLAFSLPNGDVNGDNAVNIADFLALRAAFGSSEGSANWNAMADLNGDGSVGLADFLILRANFGRAGKA